MSYTSNLFPRKGGTIRHAFIDKDPIVDYLRTLIQNHRTPLRTLADSTGVSYKTLTKLFYGSTRYPQHRTVVAILEYYNIYIHRAAYPETPPMMTTSSLSKHRVRHQILMARISRKH